MRRVGRLVHLQAGMPESAQAVDGPRTGLIRRNERHAGKALPHQVTAHRTPGEFPEGQVEKREPLFPLEHARDFGKRMLPPDRHGEACTREFRKQPVEIEHQHRRDNGAKTPAATFHLDAVAVGIQELRLFLIIAQRPHLEVTAVRLGVHLLHEREFAFAEAVEVAARVTAHDKQDFLHLRCGTFVLEVVTAPPLAFQHALAAQHLERTPHRPGRRPESRAQVLDGRQRATRRYLAGFPVLEQQAFQAIGFALVYGDFYLRLLAPEIPVTAFRINLPLCDQILVRAENRERRRPRRRSHLAHGGQPVAVLVTGRFNPLAKILDRHRQTSIHNSRYTLI